MTYRKAVESAIASWQGIFFHWNKSVQSENAVVILNRIMADDPRSDERLHTAVEWYLGRTFVPFSYAGMQCEKLSTTSALYKKLTEALQNADPPIRPSAPARTQPAVRHTPSVVPPSTRPSSSVVPPSTRPSSSVVPPVSRPVAPTVVASSSRPPVSSGAPRALSSVRPSSGVLPFSRHFGEWKEVEVTDIPTEHHGRYNTRPDDFQTINQRGSAQMIAQKTRGLGKKDKVEEIPEYWVELGRLIMKSKKKVGRCFSCSGIAVYTLVKNREYDKWVIVVVGNPSRDHYFVLVGESVEAVGAKDGYVIDIWDGNLSDHPPVHPISGFEYMDSSVKPCCIILPEDREGLRQFIRDRENS